MLTFSTCYVNWSCEVIQYTCDRVVKSSKNSPSTLWCHMSAELFTCSWFFNKIFILFAWSTWFAWISYLISRNCFFFSNIFPHFGNRPWLEFPFISRNLHWTPKAKHLKCLEHYRSQNHYQNIGQFPLVRDYCAKRLQDWDQQYYCNNAQFIIAPISPWNGSGFNIQIINSLLHS